MVLRQEPQSDSGQKKGIQRLVHHLQRSGCQHLSAIVLQTVQAFVDAVGNGGPVEDLRLQNIRELLLALSVAGGLETGQLLDVPAVDVADPSDGGGTG